MKFKLSEKTAFLIYNFARVFFAKLAKWKIIKREY
jgi:hypothetical protein